MTRLCRASCEKCWRMRTSIRDNPNHPSNQEDFKESEMSIQRLETGPRMSQVVVHGNTVYLAGIVAREQAGKSVVDQTKEILATIDGYLAKVGSDKTKILSANIWLAD